MPDKILYHQMMTHIGEHMGFPDFEQPRYLTYKYPQRLNVLSDHNLSLLRESGNIIRYIKMQKEIDARSPAHVRRIDKAVLAIMEWFEFVSLRLCYHPEGKKKRIVILMPVWGDKYRKYFTDYTAKTLLAKHNLPFLAKKMDVTLLFITDAPRSIREDATVCRLEQAGVELEHIQIPANVLQYLTDENMNYIMLGVCGSLGLQFAEKRRAAFHHGYPDMLYSERFFRELYRIQRFCENNIFAPGMRGDIGTLLPAMNVYTKNGVISVSAEALLATHMVCLHASAMHKIVNNRPAPWSYPADHVIVWETPGTISFNSPHASILWLSAEVVANAPMRYYATLDSELDLLIKDGDFYMPQPHDSLYMVEFSEPGRNNVTDTYVKQTRYPGVIWGAVGYRDTMKFFMRSMTLEVDRFIYPVNGRELPEMMLEKERTALFNTVFSEDATAGVGLKKWHNGMIK